MIGPVPFRAAPAQKPYRPCLLRRSAVKRTLADPGDRAIRACIVACSALFLACAGLAVTL